MTLGSFVVVKNLDAYFLSKYSPKKCIFSVARIIFLAKFQILILKLRSELAPVIVLLKNDKFGSHFVLIETRFG